MGWRLPALQELSSLVDPANSPGSSLALPPGHPFLGIEAGFYFSATTAEDFSTNALGVFFNVFLEPFVGSGSKSLPNFVWCVRGGQGANPQ
jgi:hypothetical protein